MHLTLATRISLLDLLHLTRVTVPILKADLTKSETIVLNAKEPYNVEHWKDFQKNFNDFFSIDPTIPDGPWCDESWNKPLYNPWSELENWTSIHVVNSHYDLQWRMQTIRNAIFFISHLHEYNF